MKKLLSLILVGLILSQTFITAYANYTFSGDEYTQWDGTKTDLLYADPSVYDNVNRGDSPGLQPVDYRNLADMKSVADSRSVVPSVELAAQASGDIINVEAQKVLFNMGTVVDHMSIKQLTIGDLEAIHWSFIISQFATPYQENLQDVLTHSLFQQMLNLDLEITASPEASTGTMIWQDVWKPDTKVADTVKFSTVANAIKKKNEYRSLYDASGKNRVNLFNFLTSDLGTVYYILDQEAGITGVDPQTLWDSRASLMTTYKTDDIFVKEKLVPVYVQSNATKIQNQVNLGSFLKGQSATNTSSGIIMGGLPSVDAPEVSDDGGDVTDEDNPPAIENTYAGSLSDGREPTFRTVIGQWDESAGLKSASGTMGHCDMYVDAFGNLCVYHDNKMKIVLCNAQNPIFTSRPSSPDDPTKRDTVKTVHNGVLNTKEMPDLVEIQMRHLYNLLQAGGTDGEDLNKAFKALYSDDSLDVSALYTIRSNEMMALYTKPTLTAYSQTVSPGAWDSDKSIYFTGDTTRVDFPGYLEFKREYQNSHRNQLIFLKPASFLRLSDVDSTGLNSDNIPWPLGYAKNEARMNEYGPSGQGFDVDLKNHLYVEDRSLFKWLFGDASAPTTQNMFKVKAGFFIKWEGFHWGKAPVSTGFETETPSRSSTTPYLFIQNYNNLNLDAAADFRYNLYGAIAKPPSSAAVAAGAVAGAAAGGANGAAAGAAAVSLFSDWLQKENIKDALVLDMLEAYNHMFVAGMGFDRNKMIPNSMMAAGQEETSLRTYTVGGVLIPTLDYGQYWPIANEANSINAEVQTVTDSAIYSGDGTEWEIRAGLMKPYNKVISTMKEEDFLDLEGILIDIEDCDPNNDELGSLPTWESFKAVIDNHSHSTCEGKKQYEEWIKDHMWDYFADNVFLQLRDLRVSDQWITYGKEEIALISYTWLNYYLPRGLWARTFIEGTYETSPMFKHFLEGYNKGLVIGTPDPSLGPVYTADDYKKQVEMTLAEKNAVGTSRIDGSGDSSVRSSSEEVWKDTTPVLGPYKELHFENTASMTRLEYKLYPDTAPVTTAVKVGLKDPDTGDVKVVTSDHVDINVYDLMMALYANTNAEANQLSTTKRGVDIPVVDKNEILQGLAQFIKNPGSTLVSWISGLLQSAHRSLAQGSFSSFFRLAWITDTKIWQTVWQYYFAVVTSLVAAAMLYLFVRFYLDKRHGLIVTSRRLVTSVVLIIVPVLLMNNLVWGLDAISKRMLTATLDKAAVVETGAMVIGVSNANAEFEYSYQLFREQFDSLEDVLGKYSYQIPASYFPSLDQFTYKNVDIKDRLYATAWTGNQRDSGKWYDYRAFVPIQKDQYHKDLYFYFYDYIKWQMLQYLATLPDASTQTVQTRAREFVFGTPLEYSATRDTDGKLESNLGQIQTECLDDTISWITDKPRADFIANLEKLMLQGIGNYAIMMNDPNYIYGESFVEESQARYGGYYYEDMFGLGYLLTDIYSADEVWEPSDELYKYPGWERFKHHNAIKPATDKGTMITAQQNTSAYINTQDIKLGIPGSVNNPSRNGRVYASEIALMKATGYDYRVNKTLPKTVLETRLIKLNERIYNRVKDLLRFFPASTPNEAYLCLAAATASFEFTKEFGGGTILQQSIEPSGFNGESVTLDSVYKGIFSHGTTDVLQSRELMYMLVDNAGGFGIVACVIVVIADLLAFIVVISRNILVTIVFLFAVVLCIIHYAVKKDYRNKVLLGVATQVCGIVFGHLMTTVGLNLLTFYSVGGVNIWKDIMLALLIAVIFLVDSIIHCTLLWIVFKDFGSLGGNIVAQKMGGLKDMFASTFKGTNSKFNKADFNKVKEQRQRHRMGNMKLAGSTQMNRNMKRLARAMKGQNESQSRGMFGFATGLIGSKFFGKRFRKGKGANAAEKFSDKYQTKVKRFRVDGMQKGIAMGSDTRLAKRILPVRHRGLTAAVERIKQRQAAVVDSITSSAVGSAVGTVGSLAAGAMGVGPVLRAGVSAGLNTLAQKAFKRKSSGTTIRAKDRNGRVREIKQFTPTDIVAKVDTMRRVRKSPGEATIKVNDNSINNRATKGKITSRSDFAGGISSDSLRIPTVRLKTDRTGSSMTAVIKKVDKTVATQTPSTSTSIGIKNKAPKKFYSDGAGLSPDNKIATPKPKRVVARRKDSPNEMWAQKSRLIANELSDEQKSKLAQYKALRDAG